MSNKIVAIAGFTGKLARLITNRLLTHDGVTIHGIARSIDKVDASIRSNPRVKLFEASATDSAALRRGLAGAAVCICGYLGDNELMIEGQKTLIDACIAEGVPRYVVSDWGIDHSRIPLGQMPQKDHAKHVSAYLADKERAGHITGVQILNGAFLEIVWAPFLGWIDVEHNTFRYYGTGEELIETTTYTDAANFTAEVALDDTATGTLNILGDRVSILQLARLYEETYGVKAKVERLGSLDDLHAAMLAAMKANPDNLFAWMGLNYQYYMASGATLLGPLHHDKYHITPTTASDFVKKHTIDTVGAAFMF